ncbi:DUF6268 family outer membrane beta-barrel protein [Dysgonomonas macrotermitis]|uniref:DUF6268 domain-containing protein n=1 Tax=Dysgonomonas macrotermitis TaxID=1346286 RepID=A0A1M5IBA2_9BACT|nr:DUF6268 family outer membrane beta-barrel protein [Dysgonomonas macrotermitis]SHG25668.1 hypothetical protein SAMN05444362_11922 [Dysgonomonas macrotermitis]
MNKLVFALVIVCASQVMTVTAQTSKQDSLARELRSYVARNFSKSRTFNLYWETNPSYDYKLKQNEKEIENGKMRDIHTIKFAATVPVVLLKNFSLYVNGQANFYKFEALDNTTSSVSSVFAKNEDAYNYYKGTLSGAFRTKIGSKHLILNANISGDGWDKGFEEVEGTFSAVMLLKNTPTTSFSIGVYGMTLYDQIPVLPIVTYWHQFNPKLSVDVTLPSSVYLRYQLGDSHRVSLGTSMDGERFYMRPEIEGLPKTCLYSSTAIKPQLVYEFIINKHFYLIARGGASGVINSGFYKTDRKGVDGDPLVEFSRSMTPFFNLGFSYNLFK